MKKILIVDESSLFKDFWQKKMERYGFEVILGVNGLDCTIKMRNEMPDLVIMDYYLSRKSAFEVLTEKKKNRNTADIPVVMVTTKVDKSKVIKLANLNVKKILSKPVKMDVMLKTISEVFNVKLEMDATPCIIEAHFNDDILFIEIAQGLNTEKIELLQYKIKELLDLYQMSSPKILIMMSNIELPDEHKGKIKILLDIISEYGQTDKRRIKVLTSAEVVKNYIQGSSEYSKIGVTDNLSNAMDDLIGLKADDIAHDEVAREKLLTSTAPKRDKEETIKMGYDSDFVGDKQEAPSSRETGVFNTEVNVAVVDDDMVIQELVKTVFEDTSWNMTVYNNGKEFMDDPAHTNYELVFLDLMMPEMDGFQVLQKLQKNKVSLPIIVFSALSQKETVVRALGFGVRSYLIKPLKPEQLMRKAEEILTLNF